MARAIAHITIVATTVGGITSVLLLGQWLAWNGPEWLMMDQDGDGVTTIGMGTVFALIACAVGILATAGIVLSCVNCEKPERGM